MKKKRDNEKFFLAVLLCGLFIRTRENDSDHQQKGCHTERSDC